MKEERGGGTKEMDGSRHDAHAVMIIPYSCICRRWVYMRYGRLWNGIEALFARIGIGSLQLKGVFPSNISLHHCVMNT